MGSRRTHTDRHRSLRQAGLTEHELARLKSPIGLGLGARTPEETALSIAAEIIATRHGGTGNPLTDTRKPIHRDAGQRAVLGSRLTAARHKRIVLGFVALGIKQKKPQETADRYLGDLIQHNPRVADGKEGWLTWAKGFVNAVPDVNVDFKRVLADGDLVTVHSHITVSAHRPWHRGHRHLPGEERQDRRVLGRRDGGARDLANDNTMF